MKEIYYDVKQGPTLTINSEERDRLTAEGRCIYCELRDMIEAIHQGQCIRMSPAKRELLRRLDEPLDDIPLYRDVIIPGLRGE